MKMESILKLEDEIITVEELAEIKESECVEYVRFNGLNEMNMCKWYSIFFNETFIKNCEDVNEIQVYVK